MERIATERCIFIGLFLGKIRMRSLMWKFRKLENRLSDRNFGELPSSAYIAVGIWSVQTIGKGLDRRKISRRGGAAKRRI